MQIYIFNNSTNEVEPKQGLGLPIKNYNEYSILDILYIFVYYAHSVHVSTFKSSVNA